MAPTPSPAVASDRVEGIRHFNRRYTRHVGALDEGHLRSAYSLSEVRVLYELAHWGDTHPAHPAATDLVRELGLDAGYLSRLLGRLERGGLVQRTPSSSDRRQTHLLLTASGHATFAELDTRAREDVSTLLRGLTEQEQVRLLDAMSTIESLLSRARGEDLATASGAAGAPYLLRQPNAGDLGWVVSRHGSLYAAEYAWDERFEALVARIVADFVEQHDARCERCWIAERDGRNVGSVFLVRHPERPGVARLRLLLVEPSARGLGIGGRLVDECARFARQTGYHTITLWTNSVLVSARRIYEAAGYRLIDETPHLSFGHELVGQTWELSL